MVKHLVMWNFKEDFPEEKKEALAKEADARLKALVGQIKGLTFAGNEAEQASRKQPGTAVDIRCGDRGGPGGLSGTSASRGGSDRDYQTGYL